MNKQQKTYLLLGAVLCIWGFIAFQFFNGFKADQKKQIENFTPVEFTLKKEVVKEKYIVLGNLRDPFLGTIALPKKKVIKKRIKKAKSTIPFPSIVYNGRVANGKTKSYVVTINGNQEILRVGNVLKNVILTKATKTSITVRFEGVTKTITLQ